MDNDQIVILAEVVESETLEFKATMGLAAREFHKRQRLKLPNGPQAQINGSRSSTVRSEVTEFLLFVSVPMAIFASIFIIMIALLG